MATIYQRNGIYYLNYSINGKRVRKVVGTVFTIDVYQQTNLLEIDID